MIRVSVLYPHAVGKSFDHVYYREMHMPLVQARLGEACASYEIDVGLSGAEADSPPPFAAACHIFSESEQVFRNALAAHADEINGDVAKYTDIAPLLQISRVEVD